MPFGWQDVRLLIFFILYTVLTPPAWRLQLRRGALLGAIFGVRTQQADLEAELLSSASASTTAFTTRDPHGGVAATAGLSVPPDQ